MATFLPSMPPEHEDRAVFSAMLAIHERNYSEATAIIERARTDLEPELTALCRESLVGVGVFAFVYNVQSVDSYARGYKHMVQLQKLTELEEVILYKKVCVILRCFVAPDVFETL